VRFTPPRSEVTISPGVLLRSGVIQPFGTTAPADEAHESGFAVDAAAAAVGVDTGD
jgi:hypothetical protein